MSCACMRATRSGRRCAGTPERFEAQRARRAVHEPAVAQSDRGEGKGSLVAVWRGKRGGEAPGLLADALGARRVDGGNRAPEQAFRHGRRQAAEARAQRPWQAAGIAPHAVEPAVFRIAAEQLVAAVARERDGDVLLASMRETR